jgi:uncharacterized membrane protein YphA (DoxX/SURF4 family)
MFDGRSIWAERLWTRTRFVLGVFAAQLFAFFACVPAYAHERWVLTPDQMRDLNSQPKPDLYTSFSLEGLLVLGFFGGVLMFLIYMHYFRYPAKWWVFFSGGMQRFVEWIQPLLRLTLGWTLIASAMGLVPRLGNSAMSYPTLLAPDLELAILGPGWSWLGAAQIILGFWFMSGLWTRMAAIALLVLIHLALGIYGEPFLAYYPTFLGIAIYLLVRGGGRGTMQTRTLFGLQPVIDWFESVPMRYPQLILRVLAGINFIYLGVWFKVLQPNLMVGIIEIYQLPVMCEAPECFTLIMTCVEIVAGIAIMAGILIRPAALFLFGGFIFFAFFLPEGYDAHLVFYGVLMAFILGGPGRLSSTGIYQRKKNHGVLSKRLQAYLN